MKLRKALDKASETRKIVSIVKEELQTDKTTQKHLPENQWMAPEYKDSKQVKIDPDILEDNRGVSINCLSDEIEQYRVLRSRIHQQAGNRKLSTIMVTSANKNEGKTLTCINMGLVFAKELYQTVLLVDCDFTGQNIHKYFGIKSNLSLVNYFLDQVPLSELIVWPQIEKLTLISGDNTSLESSELLSSYMMKNLINEMSTRYDDRYIFFDTPGLLERSETISMAQMVDGVIMVVEAAVTTKKDIQRALQLIPKEKFLGFVFNKQV